MRAGIVGIFFFAAVLALGHYVAAPFFCRGGISIPSLDPRSLCGADLHLSRSGSVLLYFGAIALAMIFGVLAGVLPGRAKKLAEEKSKTSHAETFEQIVAVTEAKEATASTEKKEPSTPPVAHPSALAASTPAPAETPAVSTLAAEAAPANAGTPSAAVTPEESKPADAPKPAESEPKPGPSAAEAAVAAAILSGMTAPLTAKPEMKSILAAAEKKTGPLAAEKPASAAAETVPPEIVVTKSVPRGPFDGTNQELVERFRELKKDENVNSIAQAQRLLDESTLSALGKGVDPKQHLSDIAHLVLAEDPDLKSGVVRGVVVHIAARLKELGVVQQIPNPAKPAKPAA